MIEGALEWWQFVVTFVAHFLRVFTGGHLLLMKASSQVTGLGEVNPEFQNPVKCFSCVKGSTLSSKKKEDW